MESSEKESSGAVKAAVDDSFLRVIEDFRETIVCRREHGLTEKNKKEIENLSADFALKITEMTGIEHDSLVQFSDDHNLVQVTIQSRDDLFCFVRAGGTNEK